MELESDGYGMLKPERFDVIVLAPADYWQELSEYDAAWLDKIAPGLTRIARALTLGIQFIELETGRLEMGRDGGPPELDGDVGARMLYCSAS